MTQVVMLAYWSDQKDNERTNRLHAKNRYHGSLTVGQPYALFIIHFGQNLSGF